MKVVKSTSKCWDFKGFWELFGLVDFEIDWYCWALDEVRKVLVDFLELLEIFIINSEGKTD